MSQIKLDLKRFKHVKSDDKSTTLQHPDGHTITLHHNILSPDAQKQLKALASSAQTPADKEEKQAESKNEDFGKVAVKDDPPPPPQGKVTKKFADGGKATSNDDYTLEGGQPSVGGRIMDDLSSAGNYLASLPGKVLPSSLVNTAQDAQPAAMIPQVSNQPPPDNSSPVNLSDAKQEVAQQQQVASQQPPVGFDTQANGDASQQQDSESSPSTQQPSAGGGQPAPASAAQPQASNQPQSFTDHVNQLRNSYLAEDKAWSNDLNNGHITPKTYESLFADKSTGGKIGTLFGLLVGGLGAGLTHSENPITAQMDKVIENDLKAQMHSKENAQNFLRLSEEHDRTQSEMGLQKLQGQALKQQNAIVAENLTRMRMNRAMLHKLTQQVQALPNGSPQRQAAEQTLAMISQGIDAQNYSLADVAAAKSALVNYGFGENGENSNSKRAVDYDKITRLSRAGLMSPADASEATKEAVGVEEARALRKSYMDSFDKLNSMHLAGKLSPNQRAAEINALSAKMAQTTAHRFNLQEAQSQAEGMFPQASDWGKETREIKRKKGLELFDTMEAGTPTLNRFKLKNEPVAASPYEGQVARNPQTGARIKMINGVWQPVK